MSGYDPIAILQCAIDACGYAGIDEKFQLSSDLKTLFNKAYESFNTEVKQSYEFTAPKKKNFDETLAQSIKSHLEKGDYTNALVLCNKILLNTPLEAESTDIQLGTFYKMRAEILESLSLYQSSLEDYQRSKELGEAIDWKKVLKVAESWIKYREGFWCSGSSNCLHKSSLIFPESENMYENFYETFVKPEISKEKYMNLTLERSQNLRKGIRSSCAAFKTTLVRAEFRTNLALTTGLTELRQLEAESCGLSKLVEYRGSSLVAVTDIKRGE